MCMYTNVCTCVRIYTLNVPPLNKTENKLTEKVLHIFSYNFWCVLRYMYVYKCMCMRIDRTPTQQNGI